MLTGSSIWTAESISDSLEKSSPPPASKTSPNLKVPPNSFSEIMTTCSSDGTESDLSLPAEAVEEKVKFPI